MTTKSIENIFRGIGSVMDIAPSTNYSLFVSKKTVNQRMQEYWERTGQHLQCAMDRFVYEQKQKK